MSLAKWNGHEDVDNSDLSHVAYEVDLSSNKVSLRYGGHANPEWRGWAAGSAAYPQVVSIFFAKVKGLVFGNRDQGNCNVKRLPSDFDRCLTWCTSEVFWSKNPKQFASQPKVVRRYSSWLMLTWKKVCPSSSQLFKRDFDISILFWISIKLYSILFVYLPHCLPFYSYIWDMCILTIHMPICIVVPIFLSVCLPSYFSITQLLINQFHPSILPSIHPHRVFKLHTGPS